MKTAVIAAAIVILTVSATHAWATIFNFTHESEFNLGVFVRTIDNTNSTYPALRSINITADDFAATYKFNRFSFSTSAEILIERQQSGPVGFNNVTLDIRMYLDPISTSAITPIGPIPLTVGVLPNTFISPTQPLWDGDYGTMENFTLTGRIEIEGPNELFTDNFSWLLTPKRAFPAFRTDVSGLPLSVELNNIDPVEYDVPLSGYTGVVVDGLEVEFEVESFWLRTSAVQLDQVPEPTTSILALAALCLMVGRRRVWK